MRRYLVAITLAVLAGVALLVPQPAAALSCVHPRDQLKEYALLVQARVTRVDPGLTMPWTNAKPEAITLAVSRYFKGDGPAELHAVFDGLGWATMKPAGSEVIMGMHFDPEANLYKAGPCHLMMGAQPANAFEAEMRALIETQYGEGRPPVPTNDPGTGTGTEPRGQWVLWGSLGAEVVLIGLIRALHRRGKKS